MRLVEEAIALIYRYWRDKQFQPSEADLRVFRLLELKLVRSAATAGRIVTRMERRSRGEPEYIARRWPDE
jgi:hypothetical protein